MCNFGFSIAIERNSTGTFEHFPPENLEEPHHKKLEAFDVYGFGILMGRMMTPKQKIPYPAGEWTSVYVANIVRSVMICTWVSYTGMLGLEAWPRPRGRKTWPRPRPRGLWPRPRGFWPRASRPLEANSRNGTESDWKLINNEFSEVSNAAANRKLVLNLA